MDYSVCGRLTCYPNWEHIKMEIIQLSTRFTIFYCKSQLGWSKRGGAIKIFLSRCTLNNNGFLNLWSRQIGLRLDSAKVSRWDENFMKVFNYHFVLCTWCCLTNHFRRLYIYIIFVVDLIFQLSMFSVLVVKYCQVLQF